MVVMGARILTVAVLFVALVSLAPSARASTTIDIRGDWAEQSHFGGTSSYVMHWNAENFSSGAVSGTGGQPGADQWSMTGTINGNHVVYTEVYYGLSYTSTEDVTVAADGNSYSGTFHDSNNVTGTITATRTSGPPSSGGPPPSNGGAKRPTGVAVICTYVVATSADTCTATVGDAGAPPAVAPTGSVTFSSNKGVFAAGSTCMLVASASAPAAPSCSVEYIPPTGGGFPNVLAAYPGDAVHAGSTGSTQFIVPTALSGLDAKGNGPGGYPNEISFTAHVPVDGTKVEACVLGSAGASIKNASAADVTDDLQRDIQDLMKAVRATVAATNNQQKLVRSAQQQAMLNQALSEASTDYEEAFHRLNVFRGSSEPSDQQMLQDLQDDMSKLLDQVKAANKAMHSSCVKALKSDVSVVAEASAAKRKKAKRPTRVGYIRARRAKAGPLKLKLRLKPRLLKRLAGKRKKVVYLRVNMTQPSGRLKTGWPVGLVKKVVLKRKRG
jgi:hypothetical protein